jgi:hypothetical protein
MMLPRDHGVLYHTYDRLATLSSHELLGDVKELSQLRFDVCVPTEEEWGVTCSSSVNPLGKVQYWTYPVFFALPSMTQ